MRVGGNWIGLRPESAAARRQSRQRCQRSHHADTQALRGIGLRTAQQRALTLRQDG